MRWPTGRRRRRAAYTVAVQMHLSAAWCSRARCIGVRARQTEIDRYRFNVDSRSYAIILLFSSPSTNLPLFPSLFIGGFFSPVFPFLLFLFLSFAFFSTVEHTTTICTRGVCQRICTVAIDVCQATTQRFIYSFFFLFIFFSFSPLLHYCPLSIKSQWTQNRCPW